MARIFAEGFETNSDTVFDYGSSISGYTTGRDGGRAMYTNNNQSNNFAGFYFSDSGETEIWVRVAHRVNNELNRYPNSPSGTAGGLFYISDLDGGQGGQAIVTVCCCETPDAQDSIYYFVEGDPYGSWDHLNTSEPVSTAYEWHLLELHIKLNGDGTALVEGRVDGVDVASATIRANIPSLKYLGFGTAVGTGNWFHRTRYDDVAVNNAAGSVNNSWCGDGFIKLLTPDGVGSRTELTPSSGNNWQAVDETTFDGDSTYVEGNSSGAGDLYTMSGISLNATQEVVFAQPVTYAKRVDAGSTSRMRTLLKSGTTTDQGNYEDLDVDYKAIRGKIYETDPDTGAAWTENGINSMEAGFELE